MRSQAPAQGRCQPSVERCPSRRPLRRSLAEQCAADPHHGRARRTAASRSSRHPHGTLFEAEFVGQAAHRLERRLRRRRRPGAATVMRPRTSSPTSRSARHQRRRTPSGGHPLRPARPVVSTSTSTAAPGREPRRCAHPLPPGPRSARVRRSGRARGTLLRWMAPRKCHTGAGRCIVRLHALGLRHELVGVVLTDVHAGRHRGRPARPRDRSPWSPPTTRTRTGHRRPLRCAAGRRAACCGDLGR